MIEHNNQPAFAAGLGRKRHGNPKGCHGNDRDYYSFQFVFWNLVPIAIGMNFGISYRYFFTIFSVTVFPLPSKARMYIPAGRSDMSNAYAMLGCIR